MNLTKFFKPFSAAVALLMLSLLVLSCSSSSPTGTTVQSQPATVQRGTISTTITATGNLAFSQKDDLVFRISGSASEVNVQAGDNVTKGQVLAKLDTTDLEQAVDTANLQVNSAQIDLKTAQNAQSNIKDQELQVQSTQLDLTTAQLAQTSIKTAQGNLDTANNALLKITYPYTTQGFVLDIPQAVQYIHSAQLDLDLAKDGLKAAQGTQQYTEAMDKFTKALDALTKAQELLLTGQGIDTFLARVAVGASGIGDFWTIKAAQLGLENAKTALESATNSYKTGLDKANLALTKAQQTLSETKVNVQTGLDKANINLENAKNNLKKAQDNLAKAVLTAPYNGIITVVNITGGQQVNVGQIAISIADPTKLEAAVLVNEVDIPWVILNNPATLQVEAASAISLPAKITEIAPTATVQSGVVNYVVTVGLNSTVISQTGTPASQPGQAATPRPTTTGTPSGQGGNRAPPHSPAGCRPFLTATAAGTFSHCEYN